MFLGPPGGTIMAITTRSRTYSSASMVLAEGKLGGPAMYGPEAAQIVRFRIDGLTCAAEATRLEHRLARLPGVRHVTVNPINEIAYVGLDPEITSPNDIRDRIEAAGFGATEIYEQ